MVENEPGKTKFPVLRSSLDFEDFVGPQLWLHVTLQPALSVRPSVHPSVHLSVRLSVGWSVTHTSLFFMILFLWPHCSCPNGLVTSNIAPAHPHVTLVAVYPALFLIILRCWIRRIPLRHGPLTGWQSNLSSGRWMMLSLQWNQLLMVSMASTMPLNVAAVLL